VFKDIKNLKI